MTNKSEVVDKIFDYIDIFASEYSWSIEYSMSLPQDIVLKLLTKIDERKQTEYQISTKLMALAVNCGFSGKMKPLDNLFKADKVEEKNEGISEVEYLNSIRFIMKGLGKSPEEIEKQIQSGNITF